MNKQQIEEWIDANKEFAFVDENHAEHVIPIDKFRSLLKASAIVPREPTNKMWGEGANEFDRMHDKVTYAMDYDVESGYRTEAPTLIYKAMLQANEKGE